MIGNRDLDHVILAARTNSNSRIAWRVLNRIRNQVAESGIQLVFITEDLTYISVIGNCDFNTFLLCCNFRYINCFTNDVAYINRL